MPRPIGTVSATLSGPRRRRSASASPSSSSMAMNSSPVVLADLVDLADVGMVDARRGARFAPEALARGLVARQRRHRLDGDGALEPFVARRVDDAHPAFAELAHDGVVRDAGWLRRQRDVAGLARRPRRRRGARQPTIKSAQSSRAESYPPGCRPTKTSIISSDAGQVPVQARAGLFVPQHHHRVHLRGPARRQEARDDGHGDDRRRHHDERRWVGRLDAEQQRRHHGG